ncbi:hypothetical protein TeGR_g12598 [Tetraparma gracilis]|uniref:Uncharacterized protein n=1 Tax=Tetraparma gracilis TaxID=2962635 RepID=A0ABQ6NDC2_9STRA|nr:hypothetical protein TeGR_g12598 [Tetraparma gracilis]
MQLNGAFAGAVVFLAKKQYRKALEETTVADRRKHVYERAFQGLVATVPALTVLAAELSACWVMSYFDAEERGIEMRLNQHSWCDGITMGIAPLAILILLMSLSTVLFVNAETSLTLSRICRLKFTRLQGAEIFVFGMCALYALKQYAMRRRREFEFDGTEGILFNAFNGSLLTGLLLSSFKPKTEGADEEDAGSATTLRSVKLGGAGSGSGGGSGRSKSNAKLRAADSLDDLDDHEFEKQFESAGTKFNPGFM